MDRKNIEKLNKKFLEREKSGVGHKPKITHPWKGDYLKFTRWKPINLKDR